MTPDQIQAALAEALQAIRLSDVDGFLINPENTNRMAAAVMALVGPKKLVWRESGINLQTACGKYRTINTPSWDGRVRLLYASFDRQYLGDFGGENPEQAAQAAAQAHADAAHWSGMVLADAGEAR